MAADKTIEQLLAATALNLTDDGVIVQDGITKKTAVQLYIDLINSLLIPGAVITSGTTIPTGGKNGDVYIRVSTGQFYQKISGTWTVFFTVLPGIQGNQVFFGTANPTVTPPSNTDGDVYFRTSTGFLYKRVSGTWTFQFSMANGPQGPQGTDGSDGTNGTNGKTVLNGTINPSNLGDGVDGDFYYNTSTFLFFGPKAAGVWPSGISIIGPTGPGASSLVIPVITAGTAIPFFIDISLYTAFNKNSDVLVKATSYDPTTGNPTGRLQRWFDILIEDQDTIGDGSGTFTGWNIYGHDDGSGNFKEDTYIILKG